MRVVQERLRYPWTRPVARRKSRRTKGVVYPMVVIHNSRVAPYASGVGPNAGERPLDAEVDRPGERARFRRPVVPAPHTRQGLSTSPHLCGRS